jgi:hypothetical protein
MINTGADLYIAKMDRESQYCGWEVSQQAAETGYFRDCYNSGGLFAILTANLKDQYNWWVLSTEYKDKWFNKQGKMTPKGADEFLKMMLKARDEFSKLEKPIMKNTNYKNSKAVKTVKPMSKAEIKEYTDWLNNLIFVLMKAVELKSNIIWSV